MMKNNRGIGGFTLIEMLIVIAVIAVLAGVVLTGVSGFQASARDTRRIGDLRNVQNYLELFYNKCGFYPGSISGTTCDDNPKNGIIAWSALETTMESGGITSKLPNDPVSTKEYYYGVSADNTSYVIGASLERDNNVLLEDEDATTYGVTCEDATNKVFCIKS